MPDPSCLVSSTERLELEACVGSQREGHGVARRANAILLLDDGKSCQIALYEPLMTGLGADEAVCFADAVHPEQQTKPAFGRVRKGSNPAVKTTAGRGRVNIHGALNLETFAAPFVEPTTVERPLHDGLISG